MVSGGSMVARLKLKGIDGRAHHGVEPAAVDEEPESHGLSLRMKTRPLSRSPSPDGKRKTSSSSSSSLSSSSSSSSPSLSATSVDRSSLPMLLSLIKLQKFNGSFPAASLSFIPFTSTAKALSSSSSSIVGDGSWLFDALSGLLPLTSPSPLALARTPTDDDDLSTIITALVVMFFEKHHQANKVYWSLIARKARAYVQNSPLVKKCKNFFEIITTLLE
eukprot:TRINITY_DN4028_c0_g2_i1.p1 TRINITY_DN4028_c0_g2~~TRINITY_DN4028_c0_g2_i1.p1  ORF type:complete len:219 (-),score=53.23 TRINITY_DN4028_c0_g2_i1:8-664(-)